MLLSEIQSNLNDLVTLMLSRGFDRPAPQMEIEAGKETIYIWLRCYDDALQYKSELIIGQSCEELFDRAETWIRSQPDKHERNRAEYRKAVAAAIDLANKFGIEDAAINPLREVMEKLSKNALEHHPNPTRPVPLRPDLDDEIPF